MPLLRTTRFTTRFITVFTTLLSSLLLSVVAEADGGLRADSHAPIGVMGEHLHKDGEWMLSYRYMLMDMDGNRDGSSRVSSDEVLQNYNVVPESMTMEMHMVGAMYAPSDDLTLSLMVPVLSYEMDHLMQMASTDMGMDMGMNAMPMRSEFTTASDGLGDVKVSGLYRLYQQGGDVLILNAGLSLPTGSIDEEDTTGMSMGNKVQLPYPMQLGSGTYDLMPGLTYTRAKQNYSWGAQAILTLRLGENDNDYTLGDRFMATTWYAIPFADTLSWSVRGIYEYWGDIDGEDKKLNPMMKNMVPTADPGLRAGQRIDLATGINWAIPGTLTNRLALEVVKPVYQNLEGPQLETDISLVLGWQLSL